MALEEIIAAHFAAVQNDEDAYEAWEKAGSKLDSPAKAASDTAWKVEIAAFQAFVHEPCRSAEDVQAKLTYLFTDSVGARETLFNCLSAEEYADTGDLAVAFLESLRLPMGGSRDAGR